LQDLAMWATIFDMDGVIIDSEPIHCAVEQSFFQEYALPVTADEHDGFRGTSSEHTFTTIAARHPAEWRATRLTVPEAIRIVDERYMRELGAGRVPFISDSRELIRRLAEQGWLIAVASSAPAHQIACVLEQGNLRDVVTCFRSADDITRSKPDPEIFLAAAACLDVAPRQCWVVEDSRNGVRAAVAANMRCIGFSDPAAGAPSLEGLGAESVVDTLGAAGGVIEPTLTVRIPALS
jgi:HAD superfamily hydrolase (TIGR01509 family)